MERNSHAVAGHRFACHVCGQRSLGYWVQSRVTGAMMLLATGEALRGLLPVCASCAYGRTAHVHCDRHARRKRQCSRCDSMVEFTFATMARFAA